MMQDATADTVADDALARWRYLVARREAVIGEVRARHGDPGDYWTARSATMGPQLRVDPAQAPPPLDLLLAAVGPTSSVLDVGAGWGRFAVPLARAARVVTAVEPSASLRALLRENAARAGIDDARLRIVEAGWEEAEVAPADLVLCANVLTPLADVGPFLRKLDAHTAGRCYIVLRAVPMDAPLADLWRAIHGVPYPRETTHADAYAALDALGIRAQVAVHPLATSPWSFDAPEAAARFVRERLWLGAIGRDERADALVDRWLGETLLRDGERWSVPAPAPQQAIIWWAKR